MTTNQSDLVRTVEISGWFGGDADQRSAIVEAVDGPGKTFPNQGSGMTRVRFKSLGKEPVTIEFYQCDACDAGYMFHPGTGQWKAWAGSES